MKDTLCIDGGHSHHQFGVNLVGFHAIIFTVYLFSVHSYRFNEQILNVTWRILIRTRLV